MKTYEMEKYRYGIEMCREGSEPIDLNLLVKDLEKMLGPLNQLIVSDYDSRQDLNQRYVSEVLDVVLGMSFNNDETSLILNASYPFSGDKKKVYFDSDCERVAKIEFDGEEITSSERRDCIEKYINKAINETESSGLFVGRATVISANNAVQDSLQQYFLGKEWLDKTTNYKPSGP